MSFPPKLGAPGQVTLDRLISWTDHSDAGVKHFSGTATYRKVFDLPAESGQSKTYLDLGAVQNIAEVRLNGHDLGILWKPPFRVDVTGLLKKERNELTVRITNTWANRLIGDEFLPDDWETKNGRRVNDWPKWLLEGKPSPTGRIAFITRRLFKQTDPLLPSGLLGPVVLRAANEYIVETK